MATIFVNCLVFLPASLFSASDKTALSHALLTEKCSHIFRRYCSMSEVTHSFPRKAFCSISSLHRAARCNSTCTSWLSKRSPVSRLIPHVSPLSFSSVVLSLLLTVVLVPFHKKTKSHFISVLWVAFTDVTSSNLFFSDCRLLSLPSARVSRQLRFWRASPPQTDLQSPLGEFEVHFLLHR